MASGFELVFAVETAFAVDEGAAVVLVVSLKLNDTFTLYAEFREALATDEVVGFPTILAPLTVLTISVVCEGSSAPPFLANPWTRRT